MTGEQQKAARDILAELVAKFEKKGALTKPELIQLVVRAKKVL